MVQILKTFHTERGGKLSLGRVLCGVVKDGAVLHREDGGDTRVGGIFALKGEAQTKLTDAKAGDTVALGRLENVATGETLTTAKAGTKRLGSAEVLTPVYAVAIAAADRKDEVKLTAAIGKLHEEDPSLMFVQDGALHQMVLRGQGEIHLKVAVEKLASKYALKLNTQRPLVPYRETIRKATTQRGRHKRQTGGHGQFGDVVLDIKPLPRGTGFAFEDQISGGVVPRNFIPSVEKGVVDYLQHGPLGFPLVDLSVALTDGSYHSVDSSDAAFQTAARIAMSEGLPNCSPVLLEPIMHVKIHVPSEATPKVNAIISGRRGQILGFDLARRLARLGQRGSANAAIGTSRPHHRIAFVDPGRRNLRDGIRPFGRVDRQIGRDGGLAAQGRGLKPDQVEGTPHPCAFTAQGAGDLLPRWHDALARGDFHVIRVNET